MKKILQRLLLFIVLYSFCLEAHVYKNFDTKVKNYRSKKEKEKLFENVGCKYSNKMVISPEVKMTAAQELDYFKQNEKAVLELTKKYQKNAKEGVLAPMYLKFVSPTIGYGVFAAANIKAGDFIGVYAGTLRNLHWFDPDFKEDVDHAWYYAGNTMIVDGKYEGNELRFINHAQDPNTKRIDIIIDDKFYICYIATKDIPKNKEITVSYGDGYWNSRKIIPESITST